ncbi:carboxy-terminal domain RNA polymerase II polypeptide A small phosphatase 1-like protein [Tanacetum coccineum]|uniref:Mitochondrial import inner membrane translocase subunit TIM50 n=1 Tax=Tanacetum coccineum TaxID=301880 RepID=A0ABQ5DUB0_9ASTR
MSTKAASKPTIPRTCASHLLEILSTYVHGVLASREDVQTTKLPPISSDKKFTVFLDMDRTIIHSILSSPSNPPPKKKYSILDPKGLISHRLYRDSCKSFQRKLVKDLSGLGRDLNNVVIVDDDPKCYSD